MQFTRELLDKHHVSDLIRRFGGHSLAYSCLQPDLTYWGGRRAGFVAYRKHLGVDLVLGDPVCAPEAAAGLLKQFVERSPRPMFLQVSRPMGEVLRGLGLFVTPVGVESEIDLAGFSLSGKAKEDLRHYRNRAVRGGIEVAEIEDSAECRRGLLPISESWQRSKRVKARELQFLIRPFQAESEPGTRLFVARWGGAPVGFVVFDPMYREGVCEGYTASILRCYPSAPEGTLVYIILSALERFREEGKQRLSLGISPFHKIAELAEAGGRGAAPLFWIFSQFYRQRSYLFNFKGLSFHKSRYRPREVPSYVASRSGIAYWESLAGLRACGFL